MLGQIALNVVFQIPYMKNWLEKNGRKAGVDFQIIISEQTQGQVIGMHAGCSARSILVSRKASFEYKQQVFNKGALFNAGYLAAKKEGCDHMVLHDVDQVQLMS